MKVKMILQQQTRTDMRQSIITIIAITFALLITNNKAEAQQDPNFTLYNFNMNIINPAFAGIKDSPELNLVYRNQYVGVEDSPRTISMAYSRPLGKNLGIGVSVINDQVFILQETDIAVDISYKLQVGEGTQLYFGIKAGGGFTNIDLTRAYNGGNDPLFQENLDFFNPHIGAGLNIQNKKFYISISTPNFLRGDRFIKQANTPVAAVDQPHFYMGGGYNFFVSENLTITPRVMMRTVDGAPTSYDFGASADISNKFTAGTNYRVDEMVSIYGLFRIVDKLRFGASYDITTSSDLINDDGSLELILKYQF